VLNLRKYFALIKPIYIVAIQSSKLSVAASKSKHKPVTDIPIMKMTRRSLRLILVFL